jgi:hypothetical protein
MMVRVYVLVSVGFLAIAQASQCTCSVIPFGKTKQNWAKIWQKAGNLDKYSARHQEKSSF